jgi:putative acetyltransferase
MWFFCDDAKAPLAYALMEPDDISTCSIATHPANAGRGLASGLVEAAAVARHRASALPRLHTVASELASPVFARVGFIELQRPEVGIGGVAIHNYAMEKPLLELPCRIR